MAELTFAKQREKYRNPVNSEAVTDDTVQIRPVVDIDDDSDFGDPDEPEELPEEIEEVSSPTKPEKPAIAEKPKVKPPIAQKPSIAKVDTPDPPSSEEIERQAAEEAANRLKALQDDSKQKALTLQQRQKEAKEMTAKIASMQDAIARLTEQLPGKEKQLDRKRKTNQLLNGEENGLEKLKSAVESQVEKLLKLSAQWETHRKPLVDQIRAKQEASQAGGVIFTF